MRAIRIGEVSRKSGQSVPTIYRRLQDDPTFPKSFAIGPNIVAWDEAELDAWLEARKAAARLGLKGREVKAHVAAAMRTWHEAHALEVAARNGAAPAAEPPRAA